MHLKRDDERVILSLNISTMCLFYSEGVTLLRKKFVPFGRLFQTFSLKLNELFPTHLFAKEYYILLFLEWLQVKEGNFTPLLECFLIKDRNFTTTKFVFSFL